MFKPLTHALSLQLLGTLEHRRNAAFLPATSDINKTLSVLWYIILLMFSTLPFNEFFQPPACPSGDASPFWSPASLHTVRRKECKWTNRWSASSSSSTLQGLIVRLFILVYHHPFNCSHIPCLLQIFDLIFNFQSTGLLTLYSILAIISTAHVDNWFKFVLGTTASFIIPILLHTPFPRPWTGVSLQADRIFSSLQVVVISRSREKSV